MPTRKSSKKRSPRKSGSKSRSLSGKLASVSRLAEKCGVDKVVVRCKGKARKPNAFARYVKKNFHKTRKSGEKATTVMKRLAKKYNSSK